MVVVVVVVVVVVGRVVIGVVVCLASCLCLWRARSSRLAKVTSA